MATAHGDPDGFCVFCEIVAGRASSDRVTEDEKTLAVMDTDPGADGRLLVVAKRHMPRYRDPSRDRMQLPYEPGMPSDPQVRARCARLLSAGLRTSR